LGENGSGKVRIYFALRPVNVILSMLQSTSIAESDIEIPSHIDIYTVRGEAEPSEVNAVDFFVASSKAKVARLEAYIEELSVADNVEELEEMDPSTCEAKAGSILHDLGFTQITINKPSKDMSGGWRMRVGLARPSSSNPISFSSTNPPITWISEPLCGSKPIYLRIITSLRRRIGEVWISWYDEGASQQVHLSSSKRRRRHVPLRNWLWNRQLHQKPNPRTVGRTTRIP
jgi:hypothetical protein